MLCLLAERVLNAAAILWMVCVRLARDWHTDVAHAGLPGGKSGIAKKEQQQAQHLDTDAGAAVAVVVAARGTRSGRDGTISPSTGPLIQNANLPATPAAPAEPAAPAAMAGSKIGGAFALMVSRPRSGRPSNHEGELQGSGLRP
jgi:hypothetical protein